METVTIDLNKYRTGNVHVFSGRLRGGAVRREALLDQLDLAETHIKVTIPDDIYSINASFFLGLFGASVRHAGNRDAFLSKFEFKCPQEIMSDINDGIDRAFREQSVLQSHTP